MSKRWLALGAAVLTAASFAGSASAVGTTTVSIESCALNGGVRTVQAGTDVVMRSGWAAKTRGLVRAAINDSTVTLTADGTPVAGSWGSIAPYAPGGYAAVWQVDLGAITAPVTVASTWTFAHPIPDLLTFNPDGTPFLFAGTQWDGSCTIVPE